jgi:hypothetical protein
MVLSFLLKLKFLSNSIYVMRHLSETFGENDTSKKHFGGMLCWKKRIFLDVVILDKPL